MTDNMNIRLWHRKFQDGIMLDRYFEIENIYKNHHIWMGDQTINFQSLKNCDWYSQCDRQAKKLFLGMDKKFWLDF